LERKIIEQSEIVKQNTISTEELGQYNRTCFNIEIHGVPHTPNEDLNVVAHSLASKLDVQLPSDALTRVHRLPSRKPDQPAPIICQFRDRRLRDMVFKNRRTNQVLDQELVSTSASSTVSASRPVSIFENLSPYLKHLRWLAKTRAREAGFRYVWIMDGKLLVRKDEGAPVSRIRHVDDLRIFIQNTPVAPSLTIESNVA